MKRKSVLFATTLFFILFNCIYCHSANISAEEKSEKAKNYYLDAKKLFSQGEYQKAIEMYKQLLQIKPNFLPALYGITELYLMTNECNVVQVKINEILEIDANNWQSFFYLGQLLYKQHKYYDAVAAFRKSARLNPYYSGIFVNLNTAIKSLYREKRAMLKEVNPMRYYKYFFVIIGAIAIDVIICYLILINKYQIRHNKLNILKKRDLVNLLLIIVMAFSILWLFFKLIFVLNLLFYSRYFLLLKSIGVLFQKSILIIIPFIYLRKKYHVNIIKLCLNCGRFSKKNLLLGFYGGLIILMPFLIGLIGAYFFMGLNPSCFFMTVYKDYFGKIVFYSFFGTIVSLTIVPICEEFFFRGILFAGLKNKMGVKKTMILSAIVFSAFHLELKMFVYLIMAGIVFAYLYERTNSLIPPILAHAIYNLIVLFK